MWRGSVKEMNDFAGMCGARDHLDALIAFPQSTVIYPLLFVLLLLLLPSNSDIQPSTVLLG